MFSSATRVVHADPTLQPAHAHRLRLPDRSVVWALVVVAAGVAATSPARPTGQPVIDALWCAAVGATATWAASRSRRWPWIWFAGVIAVGSVGSWWFAAALAALAIGIAGVFLETRSRVFGALVGALAVQAMLRMPIGGFHGLASIVAAIAFVPLVWSGYDRSPSRVRRRVRKGLAALVVLTIVATAAVGVTVVLARHQLQSGVNQAKSGLELIRDGKQDEAAGELGLATDSFAGAENLLNAAWTWPARLVPILAEHQQALGVAASSGRKLAGTGRAAAFEAPYQQLKLSKGQIDLETVAKMREPVAAATAALESAQRDLADINAEWLLPEVGAPVAELAAKIDDAIPEAQVAAKSLDLAPALLGGATDRTYLVLFTIPSETRFLGGMAGSYGVLTAKGGKVEFTVSGRINALLGKSKPASRVITGHEEYLARYGRYGPARNLQNLTASPDMPTDAEITRSLYEDALGQSLDGVIVVDPIALAALLKLSGPVTVPQLSEPLTAANAANFLLYQQYVDYGDERTDRKDLLEAAGRATFEALTSRDLPGPRAIADVVSPMIDQKRLLFFPFVDRSLPLFDQLGTTGAFAPDLSGDFFSLRTANSNANKIDIFLYRSIDYRVAYNPGTGGVEATATVTLRNDSPESGLPAYLIGNANGDPTGTNKMYLSFYSPLLVSRATVDGAEIGVEAQSEAGARVYSAIVTVPGGNTVTLVLKLRGVIPRGPNYRLQILHQPVAQVDGLVVHVTSRTPSWHIESLDGLTLADGVASVTQPLVTDERFGVGFAG